MPTEVKLPVLGENVPGGEVIDVKVTPGTTVREGQPLIEIEAEKSAVEVPSPVAGKVVEVRVKKGDEVKTDQTICVIEAGDGQAAAAEDEAPAKPAKEPPAKKQ